MKTPMFVANWKMHYGPQETRAYLRDFLAAYGPHEDRTVVFCPPAVSLAVAGFALRERPDIQLGAQNIHWEDKGAFTGEISAPMVRDCGAAFVLVGHSERRQYFGVTDDMTSRKCAAAFRAGLTPILCVGERAEERDRNTTIPVVMRQLKAGISRLERSQVGAMAIAYEPVWAIGTGRTARPEDASAVHTAIRRHLRELLETSAERVPILYGGSVTTDNAASLLAAHDVNGLLVGGASLDVDQWVRIAST